MRSSSVSTTSPVISCCPVITLAFKDAFVIPAALTLKVSALISKVESSTLTESVFPVLSKPSPAVTEPAPLN